MKMTKEKEVSREQITSNYGKPLIFNQPVVIIPVVEYEELLEDSEAAKSPKLLRDLKKIRKDMDKGKYCTLAEIKKRHGL